MTKIDMDYDKYVDTAQEASKSVDAKDYDTALRLLTDLVQSDLPDLDKSMMCFNLAVVWDKKGNSLEVLRWYDRAIQFEKPHHRYFAQLEKAAYLIGIDRKEEAFSIYRALSTKPFLLLSDQQKIQAYIRHLEGVR
jgi:tetratricopeptide (TPR) repeat protein